MVKEEIKALKKQKQEVKLEIEELSSRSKMKMVDTFLNIFSHVLTPGDEVEVNIDYNVMASVIRTNPTTSTKEPICHLNCPYNGFHGKGPTNYLYDCILNIPSSRCGTIYESEVLLTNAKIAKILFSNKESILEEFNTVFSNYGKELNPLLKTRYAITNKIDKLIENSLEEEIENLFKLSQTQPIEFSNFDACIELSYNRCLSKVISLEIIELSKSGKTAEITGQISNERFNWDKQEAEVVIKEFKNPKVKVSNIKNTIRHYIINNK
jgi:hypothetical protein